MFNRSHEKNMKRRVVQNAPTIRNYSPHFLSRPHFSNFPIKNQPFSSFPRSIDINIVGRCNLNCSWCWGPPHDAKEPVKLEQWKNLLFKFHQYGTRSVIFSGGEPLLKKWLPDLAKHARELGLRTTLSTNGILLREKASEILPYIEDIGIPLDGYTSKINKIMRAGNFSQFELALDAIRYVQSNYPSIDLTVRTVVARPNLESVSLIGDTLLSNGIDPARLRWKLYQVNPIGPRKESINKEDWLISSEEFHTVITNIKQYNPLFKIVAQPIQESIGRYFVIFPDGKTHVIGRGKEGMPEDFVLGNAVENFSEVLNKILTLSESYLVKNSFHGSYKKRTLFWNHGKAPSISSNELHSNEEIITNYLAAAL
jgi:MoaA/NifB/PqqE/SkfB family radical SAM enzyme